MSISRKAVGLGIYEGHVRRVRVSNDVRARVGGLCAIPRPPTPVLARRLSPVSLESRRALQQQTSPPATAFFAPLDGSHHST
ncbi:hypothetical protein P280DRAFT_465652 [Massarina eburnea CBS 473.64]|uniref:Uncharacterized protein n=1 Tax=Massarina eburnea CBS 473.64 TaxID=1395130 RepID=A0A6A6SDE8_9PLEO|nr:hypothetical protein P280DRAFT_465652 [Massarina eburnea CBS 473.64]